MFYSQQLGIHQVDNTCAKCEKTFERWSDYHMHVMTVQCVTPRQMPPVSSKRNLVGVKQPLSDERKREVVSAWELKNKENII